MDGSNSLQMDLSSKTSNVKEPMDNTVIQLSLDEDVVDTDLLKQQLNEDDVNQLTIREFPKYYPLNLTLNSQKPIQESLQNQQLQKQETERKEEEKSNNLQETSNIIKTTLPSKGSALFDLFNTSSSNNNDNTNNTNINIGSCTTSSNSNIDSKNIDTKSSNKIYDLDISSPKEILVSNEYTPVKSCLATSVGVLPIKKATEPNKPAVSFVDPVLPSINRVSFTNSGSESELSSEISDIYISDEDDESEDESGNCSDASHSSYGKLTKRDIKDIKSAVIESIREIAQDSSTRNLVIGNLRKQSSESNSPTNHKTSINDKSIKNDLNENNISVTEATSDNINTVLQNQNNNSKQNSNKEVVWVFSPAFSVAGKKGKLFDRLFNVAKRLGVENNFEPLNTEIVISSKSNDNSIPKKVDNNDSFVSNQMELSNPLSNNKIKSSSNNDINNIDNTLNNINGSSNNLNIVNNDISDMSKETSSNDELNADDVNVIKLIHYPGSSLCDHVVPKKESLARESTQKEGIFTRLFNRHNEDDSSSIETNRPASSEDKKPSTSNSTRPTSAKDTESENDSALKSIFKPLKKTKSSSLINSGESNTVNNTTSNTAGGIGNSSGNSSQEKIKLKYKKSQQTLGKGATAIVRLSQHEDELYAVKEFRVRAKGETTKAYVKRVIAEFCISSAMHHDNIVRTVDLIRDDHGHWCEIMEYMPGGTLFDFISGRGLSQLEASNLFKQLLLGVEYIQSLGVAHRDLKPENLLLDAEYKVLKITDFGVAEVFKTPFDKKEKIISGVCGSEPYIPPEEWIGPYAPSKVDIWSCGIILHTMLLQTVPWRTSKTTDNYYQAYLHSNPPFAKIRNKEVRRLLCMMLQPLPEHRPVCADVLKSQWFKDQSKSVNNVDKINNNKLSSTVQKTRQQGSQAPQPQRPINQQ